MLDTRRAAWSVAAASTLLTAAICLHEGSSFAIRPLMATLGVESCLVALYLVYRVLRPDPIVSDLAGGLAVVIWCSLMAGVIGLAGLRGDRPLVDPILAAWDAKLGLDTRPFVLWASHAPAFARLLATAYESSAALAFATLVILACLRQGARLWKFAFVLSCCILICAVISILIPATGAFSYYRPSAEVLGRLPRGSGIYHLPKFWAYRSGAMTQIDFFHLQGAVTFPSFHCCMALATGFALRGLGWLGRLNWTWNGLVLVSTVPIGGHYGVDLVAGALLWASLTLLADERTRFARGTGLSVGTTSPALSPPDPA